MANGTTGTFYMLCKDLPNEDKILLCPWYLQSEEESTSDLGFSLASEDARK